MKTYVVDEAPGSWSVLSVAEVCSRVTSGGTPSRKIGAYFGGSIPWVKTKELSDSWIRRTEETITDEGLSNSSARLLPTNTVLMAMYGATVGKLALLGREMTCNQAACAMVVDPSIADYRYLFYQLLNARGQIVDLANGAAQQNLSSSTIKSLEFPFPLIGEQRDIAATLGALDDKIESNERAIGLLEECGAAVLSSKVQIDANTGDVVARAALLGELLSTLETGSRPRGGVLEGTRGVVSLGAQHVQSAGVLRSREFKSVPTEFANSMRRGRLLDGDILVYKDGGKPGNFIPHISAFGLGFPVDAAVINEHVYRVRAVGGISQGLLYWALRSPWLDEEMRKRGTGVAIPGLNSSNFRELPFPLLSDEDSAFLNALLDPMLLKMLQLGAESVRLQSLRDVLVPELLSGRLTVPAAMEAIA